MRWLSICEWTRFSVTNICIWWLIPRHLEVLAVSPRIRYLEDSYGLTGDPTAATSDCACRRTSFLKKADRLNMSKFKLSKQIFKLERGLGFQIFKYSHQLAELTDAGRVFIAEAKGVVSHAERTVLSARAVINRPTELLMSANRPIRSRCLSRHCCPSISRFSLRCG
jgi:hypothetical protein